MFFSTSCRERQPMIISQQPPKGFSDEMAANRQLARHAIPKNQNAFDEEVTKSTVKCYHSPARRTREQESWKEEKNEGTWKPGIRFVRVPPRRKKLTLVISPQEGLRSCLSTYYVSSLLIGHIWRSGASAAGAFSHVSYTREEIDSLLHPTRHVSRRLPILLYSRGIREFTITGYNSRSRLWPVQRKNRRITFDDRHPSLRNYRAIGYYSRCVFVTLPSFSSLPARNSRGWSRASLLSLLRRLTAPRDTSLYSTRPVT